MRRPPRTSVDTLAGQRLLDRYELLVEIGRGGRGVVYLAHDLSLDRRVALKLVERAVLNDEDQVRFEREALAAAKMDHPAIVSLFDFCRSSIRPTNVDTRFFYKRCCNDKSGLHSYPCRSDGYDAVSTTSATHGQPCAANSA